MRFAKRTAQVVASCLVIGGVFVWALPTFGSYSKVWATIGGMSRFDATTLVLVAVWNIVACWFVMTAVLPGLRLSQAAVANNFSTAVANTVPGGGAVGVGVTYAVYGSWGFTKAAITRSTLVSGLWNTFAKLGMPAVALMLLALEGGVTGAQLVAAVIGIGVLGGAIAALVMVLRSERFARGTGGVLGGAWSSVRKLRRLPAVDWREATVRFGADTNVLLRRRSLRLTLATVLSHLSLYLVLLVALRHVGVTSGEISWVKILAAFSFVRLVTALPITPGGIGVVELGYAAALAALAPSGAALAHAGTSTASLRTLIVAGVLLFRFVTYAVPIPLGAAAYFVWRGKKSWRPALRRTPLVEGAVL